MLKIATDAIVNAIPTPDRVRSFLSRFLTIYRVEFGLLKMALCFIVRMVTRKAFESFLLVLTLFLFVCRPLETISAFSGQTIARFRFTKRKLGLSLMAVLRTTLHGPVCAKTCMPPS